MNVLVAGGTGFIGNKIVNNLNDNGYKVFVLTRNIQKNKKLFTNDINLIDWETINPSLLSKINILIKLNGEKVDQLWTKSVKNKILTSRTDSTKKLLDFCINNEIIPHKLINASAVGIYGKNNTKYNYSVDENSELGDTFLSNVCLENEKSTDVFNIFENISIVQLRIGVVLRKKIISLLSINLSFSIPIPGNKNHYFPWVHVDDIVKFTHYSIEKNLEGSFNLVDPYFTSHESFFKSIIAHNRGVIKWVIFLPNFFVKLMFGKMSEMFLYGPKTEPLRVQESGYRFKFKSLKDALSNLPS